jgi:hypothetical protein
MNSYILGHKNSPQTGHGGNATKTTVYGTADHAGLLVSRVQGKAEPAGREQIEGQPGCRAFFSTALRRGAAVAPSLLEETYNFTGLGGAFSVIGVVGRIGIFRFCRVAKKVRKYSHLGVICHDENHKIYNSICCGSIVERLPER